MHIDIYDPILDKYYEKVYLSEDKNCYIDLNNSTIYYVEQANNKIKAEKLKEDSRWYGVLKCLLVNNAIPVSSKEIYDEVYGEIPEDEVSVIKSQINEIKKKNLYKKSGISIVQSDGDKFCLVIPKQDVSIVASKLWKTRPFYLDEQYITSLSKQYGIKVPDNVDDNITYMVARLAEESFSKGEIIKVDNITNVPSSELSTIKGKFTLVDVYAAGKHLNEIEDPFELLSIPEESITLSMKSTHSNIEINMLLGGEKAFFPMRHLIQIIFQTDKEFEFQILGFTDKLGENKYYIKPLSIVYV